MTNPKRLLHGASDPLVSELIAAGMEEAPSERVLRCALQSSIAAAGAALAHDALGHEALSRAADHLVQHVGTSLPTAGSALGVGGKAAGQLASSALVGAAPSGAAAGLSGAAQATVAGASLFKWVGVGLVGLASAASAPAVMRWVEHTEPRTPPSTASAQASVPPPPAASGPVPRTEAASVEHAAARPKPLPPPPAAPVDRVTPPAPHVAPVARESAVASATRATLADEMADLERARASLAAGHSKLALAQLERHEVSFPNPQLRLEALVLRMEAYAQSGRMQQARATAREILSLRASAPHAARARELLDEKTDP